MNTMDDEIGVQPTRISWCLLHKTL